MVDLVKSTGYSKLYFIYRSQIDFALERDKKMKSNTVEGYRHIVKSAFDDSKLSEHEYKDLIGFIDRKGEPVRSEEYTRLKKECDKLLATKDGDIYKMRGSLLEELALAKRNGLFYGKEYEELLRYLSTAEHGVISTEKVISPRTVPQRKRKAAMNSEHTPAYKELLNSYRRLYDGNVDDRKHKVKLFLDNVGAEYRRGNLTLKEFHEFHSALDSHEAFLGAIAIDIESPLFNSFRESLLELMSDDLMVKQCIRQVVTYGCHEGVSEGKAEATPIKVALDYLHSFFRANEEIITFLSQERGGAGDLLQMALAR